MKLQTKLSLLITIALLLLFILLSVFDYKRVQQEIYDQALREAGDIRAVLMATRKIYLQQYMSSGLKLTDQTLGFLPAHALSRISEDFKNWANSGIRFNNVSDRPRNPGNAADPVELKDMDYFRKNPGREERFRVIENPQEDYLQYSRPIWIEQHCLKCHGANENVPETIRNRYNTAYNYNVGDLRGLMSIKLPLGYLRDLAINNWLKDTLYLIPLLLISWIMINSWIKQVILTRINRLKAVAEVVSKGDYSVRSALTGSDELSQVSATFDHMTENIGLRQQALVRRTQLYQTLSKTNELLLRVENPKQFYREICDIAVKYAGFKLAWVGLINEARTAFHIQSVSGPATGFLGTHNTCTHIPIDKTEPIVINNMGEISEECQSLTAKFNLHSFASFPILFKGELIGRFNVHSDQEDFFTKDILGLLHEMLRDITFALENHQREQESAQVTDQMHYVTFHDPLTGLPNRNLLLERLNHAMARCRRHNHIGAVIHIDLDHFKLINDSLGHEIGDELLKKIANTLSAVVRNEDTVSRLSTDEYVIMLEELADNRDMAAIKVQEFVNKVRTAINQYWDVNGERLHIDCSIGITLFPDDATNATEVLHHAETAMHRAKSEGRKCERFFLPAMHTDIQERLDLENGLRSALDKQQLELYYQPQVNAQSLRLSGAEALIRWNHPEHGLIRPDKFIPILEETGLILPVGTWIVHEVAAKVKEWTNTGLATPQMRFSINISPMQFNQKDFVHVVTQAINTFNIDPTQIELEVTEGMLISDLDHTIEKMKQLKDLGISFAIDDFGTGYSSLSYLKKLPIDTIKIDRSFICDMLDDDSAKDIVKTILDIGRRFQLYSVAEGVETIEQCGFLDEYGCNAFQGYHFSPPLPTTEFELWSNTNLAQEPSKKET